MSDFALVFDPTTLSADMAVANGDLLAEAGLQTAVLISLFTDRRADPEDVLPPGADRRGWWADWYSDEVIDQIVAGVGIAPPDRIGSRLWQLSREKQLPAVLIRAQDYAAEALAWLVDDGVAASVDVTAEVVARGILGLGIAITRPDGTVQNLKFYYAWSAV